MDRGVVLLPVVGLLAAILVLPNVLRPPVDAQDRTEERLTDLETRVAALETTIASGAAGPNSGAETHVITGTFEFVSRDRFNPLGLDGDGCKRFGGYEVGRPSR